MFRYILPVGLLFASPLFAGEEVKLCPLTSDQNSCSRVLACVGDQGRWFHGRAFGRGSGTVTGRMNDGTACEGSWTQRGFMGFGQATVSCEDGSEVGVLYTYQDEWTGTVTGRGQTADGEAVQVWSGQNVLEYFDNQTGVVPGTLPCDSGVLYIS